MDLRFALALSVLTLTASYTYAQDCPLDILIAVDTSSSVGTAKMRDLRSALALMVHSLTIAPTKGNIAMCYFGTIAATLVPLVPFRTSADIATIIAGSTRMGGSTRLELGLDCLLAEKARSQRPGTPSALVIIVDGNIANPPNTAASEIRANNLITTFKGTGAAIFAFAIGTAFTDLAEIEGYATLDPTGRTRFLHSNTFVAFRQFFETTNDFQIPCPVDGNWSPWGGWSPCSATCDGGNRGRGRTCTDPAPLNGGAPCPGSPNEVERCNTNACQIPIDGNWSSWRGWSPCSATCGGGNRGRGRTCTDPTPANGGAPCPGSPTQSETCNTNTCSTPTDCDGCIIINGIGYKDLNPCWQYLQCFFDKDGSTIRSVTRTVAWGTFWNQIQINQDYPWAANCQFDQCLGRDAGFRYSRSDNCRAYWECGPDGHTSDLMCCGAGFRFDDLVESCVEDTAVICNDRCPPILPTTQGPLPCPMRVRGPANPAVFYNVFDPSEEDMQCSNGHVFNEAACTCINPTNEGNEGDCVPEFWLDFSNGVISDVSRNKYYIAIRGVTVEQDSNGLFYGVFDKTLQTELIVNGLSSFDPGETLAVYARYRRDINQNFPPDSARPAILSNSDCRPLDYSYAAYINPSATGGDAGGWVRSVSEAQGRRNTNENTDINKYIMEYEGTFDGETLTLDVNDQVAIPVAVNGPKGRVGQNSCALHIGYGQPEDDFDYFTGSIYEIRIYKCIPATY